MLELYTSAAFRGERAAIGVAMRAAGGTFTRMMARPLGVASREEAAYRALLHALWKAKGLGARRVRVYSDHAAVVDQLVGQSEVPQPLVGLYLQIKAMLNAYRRSSLEWIDPRKNTEAFLAAAEALDRGPALLQSDLDEVDLLPLWLSADEVPAGSR